MRGGTWGILVPIICMRCEHRHRTWPSALMSCEHYLFLYHFAFVFILCSQLDHGLCNKIGIKCAIAATAGYRQWHNNLKVLAFIFLSSTPYSSHCSAYITLSLCAYVTVVPVLLLSRLCIPISYMVSRRATCIQFYDGQFSHRRASHSHFIQPNNRNNNNEIIMMRHINNGEALTRWIECVTSLQWKDIVSTENYRVLYLYGTQQARIVYVHI